MDRNQKMLDDAAELIKEAKTAEDPMLAVKACATAATALFFVATNILDNETKIGGAFNPGVIRK